MYGFEFGGKNCYYVLPIGSLGTCPSPQEKFRSSEIDLDAIQEVNHAYSHNFLANF